MKLHKQLHHLEQQRDVELRTITFEFARFKGDLRHTLSPRRVIKKHPATAMLIAAAAGIMLAPGGRKPDSAPTAAPGRRHPLVARLLRVAIGHSPELRDLLHVALDEAPTAAPAAPASPHAAPAPHAANAHPNGVLASFLLGAIVPLLQRLDWQAILAAWMNGMKSHHRSPSSPRTGVSGPASPYENPAPTAATTIDPLADF